MARTDEDPELTPWEGAVCQGVGGQDRRPLLEPTAKPVWSGGWVRDGFSESVMAELRPGG